MLEEGWLWLVGIILALAAILTLARFGRQLAHPVWIAVAALGGLLLITTLLIQAEANRQTAVAAATASFGQTVAVIGITLLALALLLVLLIAGGLIVWLLWRQQQLERRLQAAVQPEHPGWIAARLVETPRRPAITRMPAYILEDEEKSDVLEIPEGWGW